MNVLSHIKAKTGDRLWTKKCRSFGRRELRGISINSLSVIISYSVFWSDPSGIECVTSESGSPEIDVRDS